MPAITSASVTVNDTWKEGGTNGRRFLAKDVTLALVSQGGLTNSIAASMFGMSKIDYVRAARDSNSALVGAAPSYDGSLLVFATVETAGTPADQTGTFRLIVAGH